MTLPNDESGVTLLAASDQAELIFQRLLNAVPDAVLVTAADGRILVINQQAETLFGFARSDVVGRPLEQLMPERFRERHLRHRAGFMGEPRVRPMGVGLELFGLHRDGHEFPVEISLSPIELAGEIAVISSIRDVSARQQAAAEREMLLAREQAARAEAQSAVSLRNEFLSAISHDLGNPVAAIRLQSKLLQEQVFEPQQRDRQLLEGLKQIESTAARLWGLVEALLDLARLQVGRALDLNWHQADLAALVQERVAQQQQLSPHHAFTLERAVAELAGEWDVRRLERAVTNLLDNAARYSPDGSRVTVRLRAECEEQAHEQALGWAVLEVEDRGIGIPAEDLPHIFERFYRGSNVAQRFTGTGIGLAGAKQIVEEHGGTLTIASQEGLGTTVTVRLPR